MNEVARSVLTSHELSTFTYYIDQYEHHGLSVDDLATALLDLLDTAEKVHVINIILLFTVFCRVLDITWNNNGSKNSFLCV